MSKASKLFYDSLEDSHRRLSNTVVVHKNLGPVYVHTIGGLNTSPIANVQVLPIKGDTPMTALSLTTSEFEIRRLPTLGYVDTADYSFYLNRKSNRQSKQGFCRGNINIPGNTAGRAPSFESLLSSKQFVDMLHNKYASFEAVFEKVLRSDDPVKKSFSKVFALSIDDMESISLWNRGIKVAVANNPKKYGPSFRLPPKFRYLREELLENGIKVE